MNTGRTSDHSGFAPAKPSPPLVCLGELAPGPILPNGEGSPARRGTSRGAGTPDAPLPSLSYSAFRRPNRSEHTSSHERRERIER